MGNVACCRHGILERVLSRSSLCPMEMKNRLMTLSHTQNLVTRDVVM